MRRRWVGVACCGRKTNGEEKSGAFPLEETPCFTKRKNEKEFSCLVELREFVVAAEHVDDLVRVHLDHLIACWSAVLAWVELAWLLGEHLAHGGCEGEAAVGVDVDFANGAVGSLAELFLRDADGIREFATVGVDDVHILLRDA